LIDITYRGPNLQGILLFSHRRHLAGAVTHLSWNVLVLVSISDGTDLLASVLTFNNQQCVYDAVRYETQFYLRAQQLTAACTA